MDQFVFGPAMFLLYHSEGCNICGGLFRKCYINDLHTTTCSGMLGHRRNGAHRCHRGQHQPPPSKTFTPAFHRDPDAPRTHRLDWKQWTRMQVTNLSCHHREERKHQPHRQRRGVLAMRSVGHHQPHRQPSMG
jgi:hypothetical protein